MKKCAPRNTTMTTGRTSTCSVKKRPSVAPVMFSPPRRLTSRKWPMNGVEPAMSVPTRVAQ
jgi:hypothetical protein